MTPGGKRNSDIASGAGTVYKRPMRKGSPLAQLRKEAPGSLTQGDIVAYMGRRGLRRDQVTISDFERAKYLGPDEFVRLYAAAIKQPVEAVLRAWRKTRRARDDGAKGRRAPRR